MSTAFSINNNSAASDILANLNYVQNQINTSYAQLSSGNRITSAASDPAGYAISQQMTSQVNGLNQATQNAQNGISLIQTASGAMNQVETILQTMNTLAVEAANGTQSSSDLSNLQQEMTALTTQISSIGNQTQFNGIKVLAGSLVASSGITFQVGAQQGQVLTLTVATISASALGVSISNISISSQASAQAAISVIQSAITSLSAYQANIGAVQDQLNYTVSNLQNSAQNLQNAAAAITNTNMASAYTQFTQQQVLSQVGLSILSQAQQQPGAILKLLS
ncbi:MAG: flagellin N-terminal helical domain-containing protein [Bacilli bacterium]